MNESKTILLVEDNEKIMEANRRVLTKAGYSIEMARNLSEARTCLARHEPEVIVLDIMLPDGNGLDFIDEIRAATNAPVLLVTALDSKDDRLAGLRSGGDDYITKPYDLDELCERVAAFLRRKQLYEARPVQKLVRGLLVVDMFAQKAFWNGTDMLLAQKEYALFLVLIQHEGYFVDTATLYEKVWKAPMMGDGNALWQTMSRLKRKLEPWPDSIKLTASRGTGYKLEIED